MRKSALAFSTVIVPLILAVALPLGCFGCLQDAPPTVPATKPAPFNIPFILLARDFETATAYVGHRIRVHLDARECAIVKIGDRWEIHLWCGDRSAPPCIVFQCEDQPPAGTIIVTGTCTPPERDGIWRSPRCNYRVIVINCSVTRAS